MKPNITIQQYISEYGDKDSIAWNYSHIARYPNYEAALQWITARANASYCGIKAIEQLDKYEDSNYTDKDAQRESDEWHRLNREWSNVAKSFYGFIYDTNIDWSKQPTYSDYICGNVTDEQREKYKHAPIFR